jgi:predicted RecA/RadA family phage recombinase
MKNFVSNGESLQIVATADVVGGQLYAQGDIVGVVVADAAIGEQFTLKIEGAYTGVPKTAAEAWTAGESLYYVTATGALTTTAAGNIKAGYAFADALAADVVGDILLLH